MALHNRIQEGICYVYFNQSFVPVIVINHFVFHHNEKEIIRLRKLLIFSWSAPIAQMMS